MLIDVLNEMSDTAVDAKDRLVKECGRSDIPHTVSVFRGHTMVALVSVRSETTQNVTSVATVAIVGFDADEIAMALETYMVSQAIGKDPLVNPITGNPWKPGDINDLVEKHDGLAKGWVTESLVVLAVNRAGDTLMRDLPYTYDGNNDVVWRKPENEPMFHPAGSLLEIFVEAMQQPSGAVHMPLPDASARTRAVRDIITMKALSGFPAGQVKVALVSDGKKDPDREEALNEFFVN